MSFDLTRSMEAAERRMAAGPWAASRSARSDRGWFRLGDGVLRILDEVLGGMERPPTVQLLRSLSERCIDAAEKTPSRAMIYKYMDGGPAPVYLWDALPPPVRHALHNLSSGSEVPEPQVVFEAFNRGGIEAVSWASALPWLSLHRALRGRGWRPRSRGLLLAVCRTRRIVS